MILSALQKTLIRWHTRPALTEKTALRDFMRALHPRMPGMELIRMGPRGDGGYLVPDDLGGVAACFSPGVAEESGFELDCANAGMQVFMADASVAKPAAAHGNFHFVRKNIGAFNAEECMTIDRWAEDSLPDSAAELILQMDIEGGEYEVFLSMSEPLMKRFRIIAAEFHALHCIACITARFLASHRAPSPKFYKRTSAFTFIQTMFRAKNIRRIFPR